MKVKNLVILGLIMVVSSCSKKEEETGFLEPIAILTPPTNPATTIKGKPISYKIVLTNDQYIDSVKMWYNVDSFGSTYNSSKDSLFRKENYDIGNKKNVLTLEGDCSPAYFPPVGKNVYLVFKYFTFRDSATYKLLRVVDKRVNLVVQ